MSKTFWILYLVIAVPALWFGLIVAGYGGVDPAIQAIMETFK
jgi:hypothetical protein